ncbi:MAG: hypothetical protein HN742_39535 [Lentisphaerae bacterium]|jgi:endo-1,4-beta-xylanase|nr:hypothetical protein [Lentisphaerota bacterium]MBT4822168.1 hypothetical protein [Lentisphaerota bacterium]MBT5612447.1 hypothetical protein [Lentisphaerota bacterium]MBT7057153.1 hypothetical protein [Lentisphaerota bacterium]MBT7848027.1 hypothetical protein [Lentisphaerota bacterium]
MELDSTKTTGSGRRSVTALAVVGLLVASHCVGAPLEAPTGGRPILGDWLKVFAKGRENKKGRTSVASAKGPGFDQVVELESKVRGYGWEYSARVAVRESPQPGDVLLWSFWARTLYTADESGQSMVEAGIEVPGSGKRSERDKARLAPLTQGVLVAAGSEWTQFFIRAQAPAGTAEEKVGLVFRCGMERQRIQLGGMRMLNFGSSRVLEDLPVTRYSYRGREADAPWRAEAKARIETLRTRELRLVVHDATGNPVPNCHVDLTLNRHAFQWGVAFSAFSVVEALSPDYEQQRQRITENFSAASFVNALKWHPWVGDWGKRMDRPVTLEALRWVQEQGLPFRGHCLVWPRKSSVSNAMRKMLEAEIPGPEAIRAGILAHLRSITAATSFWMQEWDVLNESIPCHDVQDICGDEVMVDWFKEARRLMPDVKLALNEYSILSSLTDNKKVLQHEARIRYLLDRGAPVDVLGMQSHMGGSPPSPLRVLTLLDRFAKKFNLPIRATEFDMGQNADAELLYDFTRDFYTVMFSHPQVIGVQLWGIDQMFEKNGSLSPIGRAHQDLVLDKWHTRETGKTDREGALSRRGFLGSHTATLTVDGRTSKHVVDLPPGEGACVVTITAGPSPRR